MKRPLIVLSSQSRPMEEPFRQNYHYTNAFNTDAVRRAGGLPVLPPFLSEEEARELMERADGLFLTGGEDVSPALYGEEKKDVCGPVNPRRDESDCRLMAAALGLKKPVLCICRGFQLGNACLGGSLWQDLPAEHPTAVGHSVYNDPGYSLETAHEVKLTEGSPLHRLLGERRFGVNSLHHQGIRALAPSLRPMALAPDGLVEAWYLPSEEQWLWGLQWHPEMLADSARGQRIFEAFLAACRGD